MNFTYKDHFSRRTEFAGHRMIRFASAVACLLSVASALPAADSINTARQQILPNPIVTASTVPGIGDVNPYGVAFVPQGYPKGFVKPDDIFVSNFNNNQNLQGTGRTLIRFDGSGKPTTFFEGNRGFGLSTALNVSKEGPIFVGNSPTADGTCATAKTGSVLVISPVGHLFQVLADSRYIDGPWDSTLFENGGQSKLFISNALDGTISRLDLKIGYNSVQVIAAHTVASGYVHRCDPATLFVAPTGLVYDANTDTLYVASSGDNAVFAVPYAGTSSSDSGTGHIVYEDNRHLHGALALAAAPNGHLLVTNSDGINPDPHQPSEIVEFTKNGQFIAELPVDPNQGGSFGLGFGNFSGGSSVRFAAVDDVTNTLTIWKLNFDEPATQSDY
jgi:hypothetical protein